MNPFLQFAHSRRADVEAALRRVLPTSRVRGTERFNEALDYAVFPGGKRLRPNLTFLAALLGGASSEQAITLGCAIEFVHTGSLVMDDLPAMDDATLRRGRPALHLVYGQGVAMLVVVSLLNQAHVLFAATHNVHTDPHDPAALTTEVARCIGHGGMIAGQAAELLFSGSTADEGMLSSRALKTSGLMRLMTTAGAIAAGGSPADIDALAVFGERLGQAYQIYDDLTDATRPDRIGGNGKSVGQDARHGRPTLLDSRKREQIARLAAETLATGVSALDRFGERREATLLRAAADSLVREASAPSGTSARVPPTM